MPTYDVHVYSVVRTKIVNVEAEDPQDAIRTTLREFDPHDYYRRCRLSPGEEREAPICSISYSEYADEDISYLVDPHLPDAGPDDDHIDYEASQTYLNDTFRQGWAQALESDPPLYED